VPVERLLVVDNPRISSVGAYLPNCVAYHEILTGSDKPVSTRAYPNRSFVFPLSIPPGTEQVVYLRLTSNIGLVAPLQLWSPEGFHAHERVDYAGQAWYFGIVTAMVLFNFLLFLALRDRMYLTYLVFVFFTAFTLAVKDGLVPDLPWLGGFLNSNTAYFSGCALTLVAFLQLIRRMLGTREHLPRVDRVLTGLTVLNLGSLVAFGVALASVAQAALVLFLATAVLLETVAIVCLVRGVRSAAFSLLIVGAVVSVLRALGLLPNNFFTVNALQIGSALEMILLAFALADRYNALRHEKARAQEEL